MPPRNKIQSCEYFYIRGILGSSSTCTFYIVSMVVLCVCVCYIAVLSEGDQKIWIISTVMLAATQRPLI